ncbi:MAG: SLATT domain-containing protein [Mesorhizobium sp.]|nr:MAG: SLATT domain-containing protein [Mesorhizobium sp.]RWJ35031.1 MAG: SLATT domain-containing protein [Mesorhizobium sp.]TIQ70961.1 MAG: SLATT domain-containing protein [Mesorhizobium sp.]TIU08986.1 MAG: SLATT domain-containing protein [Mesorhizobium sp.]TIU75412.1 MAG: SLATT domain-containing protein [Mesorhizobium sp.]
MPGWPTEPLIVIAASLIGWTQIKKFNELASAYTLTAHEIGLTADLITDANSDEAFSAAVNEAELAFSREHTQWVARQNN